MTSRSAGRPISFTLAVSCVAEAVAAHPSRKLVLFNGKIVARDGAFLPAQSDAVAKPVLAPPASPSISCDVSVAFEGVISSRLLTNKTPYRHLSSTRPLRGFVLLRAVDRVGGGRFGDRQR